MASGDLNIILLAAGKGTRMYSAVPKVLHTVCGKTLIARSLAALKPLQPKRTIVVVGAGRESVEAEIEQCRKWYGSEITTVHQTEQKGTGHAVQVSLSALSETATSVLILPADLPLIDIETLSELNDFETDSPLIVLTCRVPDPTGFGRIIRDEDGAFERIVEEKDCSEDERFVDEINSGVFLVDRQVLADNVMKLTANNAQGELYLTDIVELASEKGVSPLALESDDFLRLLGANTRAELAQLEEVRRLEILEAFAKNGVRFEDPHATYIDEGVTIGQDTFIGAGTRLYGATTVGSGVRIDGQSRISDTQIADNVHIKFSCVIDQSQVGEGCFVGPFAHLRPGSVLESDAHIGNFVETKKTTVKKGAKANHLTYLGDSTVGEGANVGAGTITCNYDGFHKHQTIIGAGAFIGSNTSLVAPVTVGEGAVTGAGSVISKDVPADALAVERADQKNILGWAKKNREQKKRA